MVSFDISENDELYVLFENSLQVFVQNEKKGDLELEKAGSTS